MSETICILGTGYVGLPLALILAKKGFHVIGVDIDENIVRAINEGVLLINEEELNSLLKDSVVKKNLMATKTPKKADIFIISVPTPIDHLKKIADLSYVKSALKSIFPFLVKGNLIIIESTIPPLTCRQYIVPTIESRTDLKVGTDIFLAHCPERILPGNVFYEIIHNDRIIGGFNVESTKKARSIYSTFVTGDLLETDDVTAEFTKLVENSYRDINIAFANELSLVADNLNLNIKEVISLANRHPRVNVLNPGIGVGGHCIPVDPWFIKEVDPENTTLTFTARRINDRMPELIAAKIRRKLSTIRNPRILLLGAAYKANINDIRESPSLKIFEILKSEGYDCEIRDPLVKGYKYTNLEKIVKDKDCIVVLVKHEKIIKELKKNRENILGLMRSTLIIEF